jgi:hypothetical protein
MFQQKHLVPLLALLLVTTLALKRTEAGVNDWAINTLGEVRDLQFFKNKIYVVSQLHSLAILDKNTGNVETRSMVAETEKVVGYGDMVLNAVTRYNQVVSHFVTATGLDKKTTYGFKVDNRSVQWISRFDEKSFYISKSSFHHGATVLREAEDHQIFLRVLADKEGKTAYLLFRDQTEDKYCV